MNKASRMCWALVLSIGLGGCATPARVDQMTLTPESPDSYAIAKPLTGKVAVGEVSGGEETNPMWTSEIGNTEFSAALRQSMARAKLLAPEGKDEYQLSAKLLKVEQPMFALDMTVTITAEYVLVRASDKRQVFQKTVTSSHTAKMGEAFIATERLRLANEGAARTNITDIVNVLYELGVSDLTVVP